VGVLGGFILLVFMLQHFFNPLIGDAVSIGIAFCAYFFVLDKRAIGIECPHCGKYIETNTPWKCGNANCQKDNEQVDDFPVVYHCQHCGVAQKAFKCPHPDCGQPIFLGKDKLKTIYATFVNLPEKSKPKPVIKNKAVQQQEEKRDLIHELEVTQLKGNLKEAKSKIEPPPKKTSLEELEEYYKSMMGNEDAAKKWRAAIDAEFPIGSVGREKGHKVVDQWMANRIDK